MTKELYLTYRNQNNAAILYEWYKEKFDSVKHQPFLSFNEFFVYLPMWGDVNNIYQKITQILDEKFSIRKLINSNGELINYI